MLPKTIQKKDIREGCHEAVKYNCASFYSSTPFWTPIIKEELAGTDIHIGTGIAFPFGSAPSKVKVYEVEYAVNLGCTVIDLAMMNIGALKDKRYDVIKEELIDFKKAAGGAITKVILEVCYLTGEEILQHARKLLMQAQYTKTSTGQFDGPSMEQFPNHAQNFGRDKCET